MKLISSYQLYVGMHPEDHVIPNTLAINKIFAFLQFVSKRLIEAYIANIWLLVNLIRASRNNSKV